MLIGAGAVQRYLMERYGVKISRRTIYRWLASGKLRSQRITRNIRYKYHVTEREADLSLSRFGEPNDNVGEIAVLLQKEFGLERVTSHSSTHVKRDSGSSSPISEIAESISG